MRTDYKFFYIKRDDDGFITEAAIRFFEGDYILNEMGETVYRRTKQLAPDELPHLASDIGGEKGIKFQVEINQKKAIVYLPSDFGQIKTDDELVKFCNKQIAKDKTREVVNEQKEKE